MSNTEAEISRLKYKYRRLILEGKISIAPEDAVKLIGPDCAYHLYFTLAGRGRKTSKRSRR
jgi:hypothetical protein